MSRHEGVSCDSCLKSNFRGRRYKCLICYDFDLCANCYQEGIVSSRHQQEHPMQAILTRSDFELYYGGENITPDQPQSFTCPYCGRLGFTESTLLDHVSADHTDTSIEVVCPICAALPGGDPNLVTDDFAGHLSLEHRSGSRDLISFLDEPSTIRHGGVRRIPHSGRALGGPRSRRSNMHFSTSGGGLSTLSPSGRESVDPIAELLQQLSGVRRGAPQPSQLQQLQMQIQLERQQVSAARQQLERLPRRQAHSSAIPSTSNGATSITTQSTGIVTLNGNLRDASIASPLPLGATASANNTAGALATGLSGSSVSANTAQSGAINIENFPLVTPRLWEEAEKLTEGQQKERDKMNVEKVKFTAAVMYSALRLRDPYRYMLMGHDECTTEIKMQTNVESTSNDDLAVDQKCDQALDSNSQVNFKVHCSNEDHPTNDSLLKDAEGTETLTNPEGGIVSDISRTNVEESNLESAESLPGSRKPSKSPRPSSSTNKSQVKSASVGMQNSESR